MAVVIETTLGDFTVDLFVDSRPQACKNFLKLCKMKYYNFCLFHSIQPNFLAQTGDPAGTGSGGESIYGLLYGENARYFEAEMMPKLKHSKPGLLSMVNCGNNMLGSQFFVTLGEELVSLDGEHCVFGEISEGVEVVLKFNEAICDTQHRPYKDIRITHTIILEDPFDDPSGLIVPDMSPEATQERLANGRIGADEEVDETQGLTAEEVEEMRQEREAKARATILEIVGDLPDAEMAPPENVLFVCKLNPVTTDDDLEIIFSRFGKVKSCEVIRDKNTGDSLQYAFVEFEEQKACEEAYFKMDNVLIDDRRIHVDFSQSVAKMRWKGKGRGVEYFDNKEQGKENRISGIKEREGSRIKGERSSRRERDREHEERDRRKDRGRDREEDRGRERGRDSDDRHRRRDDRERSRSDWRKRDKRDYREDDKRYDKRREMESSRKREDDSKKVSSSSSSRKGDDKKLEVKRVEEKKIEIKESRSINGKSGSRQREFEKSESLEKSTVKIEKQEIGDKERGRGSKYNSPLLVSSKDETLSDSFNDSQEIPTPGEDSEKSLSLPANKGVPEVEIKTNSVSRRSSKDDKKPSESVKLEDFENDRVSEGRLSHKSDKKVVESKSSQEKEKKKSMKRKRKESESRKRKKRRHSSSSESSSESSDSSDSSSSSDSSDYKHSKKKKLIVAKRYYRGGKLVKEVKKKKRTKDTSDSESGSEESSESDSKRKYKSKKHKKVVNVYKPGKKKSVQSSEDSLSESSSSEDSDERSRKRKKKASEKLAKKKSKHSSKKKKRRKNDSSSSSDSEDSVQSKSLGKKQKKIKNSKHSTNLVTTTSE